MKIEITEAQAIVLLRIAKEESLRQREWSVEAADDGDLEQAGFHANLSAEMEAFLDAIRDARNA